MKEIEATPLNGLKVASTFSGCGGSCLGLRMAGYQVLWANEFTKHAAETYKANHPGTYLCQDDIRKVEARDILKKIGLRKGELDIFEGSPPCDSFTAAGKGSKLWGKEKKYFDTSQRTDDLTFEWIRLLRGLKPRAFIVENVSGLVRGHAKGYFLEMLAAMKKAGYRVEARVLNAEWLGVPQHRERVIFLGVRKDLGVDPVHPKPFTYRYSWNDAMRRDVEIEDAPTITAASVLKEWRRLHPGESVLGPKLFGLKRLNANQPSSTVTQFYPASITHPNECRYPTIPELKRLSSFPDDFKLEGKYTERYARMGLSVPPLMMKAVGEAMASVLKRA